MFGGPDDRARRDKRRRQAARWWVALGSEADWSATKHRAWQRWITDERNVAELKKFEQLDGQVRALPRDRLSTLDELHSDASVAGMNEEAHRLIRSAQELQDPGELQGNRPANHRRVKRRRLAFAIIGGAVTLVVVALALAAGVIYFSIPVSRSPVIYRTSRGEQRTVTLEDSTKVTLGGQTTLIAYLTPRWRKIVLEQGEALFQVADDPRRPFEVDAEDTHVTDLGTTFDVRRYRDGQVLVGVTEGAVAVKKCGDPSSSAMSKVPLRSRAEPLTIRVVKGTMVSLDALGSLGLLYPVHAEDVTAWRSGSLIYRDAPLERIIEDLQRNSMWRIDLEPDVGGAAVHRSR